MAESFFDRHFVWWSSRESIAAEKISLLAVAEVIFSVAAYWGIAWYFDTYAHLLISILVAPLVLLRSDESVALGVEMFSRYWSVKDIPLRPAKVVAFVILSSLSAGCAGWLAASWFLIGIEGWSLFWRSAQIGLFALNIGTAVAIAAAVAVAIVVTGAVARGGAIAAILAVVVATMAAGAVAIAVAVGVAEAGAVAAVGAVVGAVAGAVAVAVAIADVEVRAAAGVATLAVGPSFGVGILARAVATRLFASLRHILMGAIAFPKNWRHALFQIDLGCAPELVPGIEDKHPDLSLRRVVERAFLQTDIYVKTLGAILIPILFLPSLIYRYSIKSTCWLYLPLIYLAHLPGRLRDGEGRLVWVRALPAKFIEGIRFALAVLTLGIAFFALIDAAALRDLLAAAGAGETPVTVFSLLVVLDFGDIRPWQYFTLPSAALTILLFLWLDSIRKDEAAGATTDALGWKISTAILADRVRSLLVYIWLALALYYFAEYAYCRNLLPGWMVSWLEWRFDPATCPAPSDLFRRHLGVV